MKKYGLVSLFLATVLILSSCGAVGETTGDTAVSGNTADILSEQSEEPDTGTETSFRNREYEL